MRKIIIGILAFLLVSYAEMSAQDYSKYLESAFEQLGNGNIESAKSQYAIYKDLTQKTSEDFESLLVEKENVDKENNDWRKDCHIINLTDSIAIAIQKTVMDSVTYNAAAARANFSRLGGFCDWRLPLADEQKLIFANIIGNHHGKFWIQENNSINKTTTIPIKNSYGRIIKKVPISVSISERYVMGEDYEATVVYTSTSTTIDGKSSKKETGDKMLKAPYFIVRTFRINTPDYESVSRKCFFEIKIE